MKKKRIVFITLIGIILGVGGILLSTALGIGIFLITSTLVILEIYEVWKIEKGLKAFKVIKQSLHFT